MTSQPSAGSQSPVADERSYAFNFAPLSEGGAVVRLMGWPEPSLPREFRVSLDDSELGRLALARVTPVVADLFDLAAAIYVADRLSPYYLHWGCRHVRVRLPLRCPAAFKGAVDVLAELLDYTTGSEWSFEFPARTGPGRSAEQLAPLPFDSLPVEVALWSGGLDALAGLCNRAAQDPDKRFALIGVGGSDIVLGRQRVVSEGISQDLGGRISMARLPIRHAGVTNLAKNGLSRARGVVYALAGSAAAVLFGTNELAVYENGVGALNLPYTRAHVGLDHSRSVHPLSLRLSSLFLSAVLGEPFRVHNPFLFQTKAQMIAELTPGPRLVELVALTSSCDSPHRRDPVQCGYCSSCVLRRQSLAAAGVTDDTRYVVPHADPPVGDVLAYVRLASAQADRLGALAVPGVTLNARWERLAREHPVLDDVVDWCADDEGLSPDAMRLRLVELFTRHANDWDVARPTLAAGGLPVRLPTHH